MMTNGAAAISAAIISTLPTIAPAPPSRMPSAFDVAERGRDDPHDEADEERRTTIGTLTLRTTGWRHMRSIFGT